MAYEVEAVSDTPNQVTAPAEMRPERVVNIYSGRNKASAPAPVGQTDTSGAAPAAEPATPAETVRLAPQAAALARKELQFRQREQKLNEQLKAIEAREKEIAEYKAMKEKLAAKDYSAVENLVNYEEYAQYLLNKQANTDPTTQKIQSLESKLDQMAKADQERTNKAFDAAVSQRRDAVKKLVASNEQFSSIKALNREDAVVQHILDTWEHDSEELSVEQAAQEVEELLVERAQRYAALPKLKPKVTDAPGEDKKALPPLKPGLKTITNQVTSGDLKKLKPLSLMNESERYAEARRRALARLQAQPPKSA